MHRDAAGLGFRGVLLALAGCLVAGLIGCTPTAPAPSPSPTPVPAFASDEDAYEAAVAVYADYSRVSEEVGRAGGAGAEAFLKYTDTAYANQLLREVHAMRQKGLRFTGAGTFEAKGLEEIDELRQNLGVRFCEGVGDTRLIDADGNDITNIERQPVTPIIVSFTALKGGRIVITGSDLWSGDDFC